MSFRTKCLSRLLLVTILMLVLSVPSLAASQKPVIFAYSDEALLHFDPSSIYSVTDCWASIYETLLRYHPETDEFEPILATSYEVSPDGLEWVFYLRQGVKFHTGNTFDAETVKFSLERTKTRGEGISYVLDPIKKIEVMDPYTVKFYLDQPAALDLILASLAGAYIFDPEFSDHDWFNEGNDSGTGPYIFVSHEGLEQVVMKKFDDYWGGWKENQIDTIIIKTFWEDSTRLMMLKTGEADYTNYLALEMMDAVRSDPTIEIVEAPMWQNLQVYFNTLKPPLDNKLVRKALAYAIPYDKIIDGVLLGFARKSVGSVMNSLWGWSDTIGEYTYNLAVAKALLTEAGYPEGGLTFDLTYSVGDTWQQRTVELWNEELAKLNIHIDMEPMPWQPRFALAQDPDPNKRQDIFIMYSWPLSPAPIQLLQDAVGTGKSLAVSYYSNPVVDNLMSAAANIAGIDRAGAAAIIAEVQNIVREDAPVIPIADLNMNAVKSVTLKGPSSAFSNPAYPRIVFWYSVYRD